MVADMSRTKDLGPWFVRVAENKVSVGIFACSELELADLIDEVCEPELCEYKRLPSGGFIFGGDVVLHEYDSDGDADYMDGCSMTEEWGAVYDDAGPWERIDAPYVEA